jgi:anthranilate synthase/aminodeoxychorismate synthase-like glutamine amidotransferase
MILIIDNYDSFTFNLVQYIGELGGDPLVVRNDRSTVDELLALKPTHLVVSPGPGDPESAGVSCEAILRFGDLIPVLGVCLGHQCLAQALGGRVIRAERMVHGKVSQVYHHDTGLFRGLANPLPVGRYHSLIVEETSMPASAEIAAYTADGEIMGIQERGKPVYGVQFHPESILTPHGKQLLKNFLSRN